MASKALLASVVVVLGLVMIVATSVLNSGYVLAKAKRDSGSKGMSDGSSGSSSSGGSNSGDNSNSGVSGDNSNSNNNDKINNPLKPSSKDTKDISDIPGENCNHGKCASPIIPTPTQTPTDSPVRCADNVGRHCPDNPPPTTDNPGNFRCLFHNCIPNTIVIHKTQTKVVHRRDLIGIPTVFVPKVGLVEPFACKLNENSGKIGCEFIVIKVIG